MIAHDEGALSKLTDADRLENERRIIAFRNTFNSSEEGRDTWEFLHKRLGTFNSEPNPTPEALALQRFGMEMLEMAGINYEVNLNEVTNILWKVRPSYETVKLILDEKRGKK